MACNMRSPRAGLPLQLLMLLAMCGALAPLALCAEDAAPAEVNAEQKKLTDQLFDAVMADDPTAIYEALQAGADINSRQYKQNTPIMRACLKFKAKAVKYLLEMKPDLTIPDAEGYVPLEGCAFNGMAEEVKALLDAGADPMLRSPVDGLTAFHRALWGDRLDHMETVRVFLEAGVPYNLIGKDDDGKPARPYNMVRANGSIKRLLKEYKKKAAAKKAGEAEADADAATAAETAAEL